MLDSVGVFLILCCPLTLLINLAAKNAGIYSTCLSDFLVLCHCLRSLFSCPKSSDQNEGFFGLILVWMFIKNRFRREHAFERRAPMAKT